MVDSPDSGVVSPGRLSETGMGDLETYSVRFKTGGMERYD